VGGPVTEKKTNQRSKNKREKKKIFSDKGVHRGKPLLKDKKKEKKKNEKRGGG